MEDDLLYFKIILKRDEYVFEENIGKDTNEIINKLKTKVDESTLLDWLESEGFGFYEETDPKQAIFNIKITNCDSIKGIDKFLLKRETRRIKKLENISNECIKLQDIDKGTYIIITFEVNRREIGDMEMVYYFMIDEDLPEDGVLDMDYNEDYIRIITDERLRTISVLVRKTPFPMQGGRKKRNTNKRRRKLNRKSRK